MEGAATGVGALALASCATRKSVQDGNIIEGTSCWASSQMKKFSVVDGLDKGPVADGTVPGVMVLLRSVSRASRACLIPHHGKPSRRGADQAARCYRHVARPLGPVAGLAGPVTLVKQMAPGLIGCVEGLRASGSGIRLAQHQGVLQSAKREVGHFAALRASVSNVLGLQRAKAQSWNALLVTAPSALA